MNKLSRASIEPDKIVEFLKKNVKLKEVYQRILYQRVIEQAAQAKELTVTPTEIQAECDRLRHEKRLEKASDTIAWLADQMITVEDLEAGIHSCLLEQKLAQYLFAQEVEKFFAQNRIDFDQVLLYQIVVPYERVAQEVFYQIEEREISFYEAAHLYDIDEQRRQQCGFEGKLYRWNLKPDLAAVLFSAQPGELIGPLQVIEPLKKEPRYHLLMVEEFIPAKLTPQRHQEILDKLFQQWLASELNYMLHSQTA